MFTEKTKIDFTEIATDIAEWAERNYGYFVNKSRDEAETVKDFATQLARLPIDSMSYIEQAKNNFIDSGRERPPLPPQFINELKIIFNQNKKVIPKPFLKIKKQFNDDDNVGLISFQIFKKNNDFDKIKFIKNLSKTGQLQPIKKYPIMRMIEKILKENNYSNEKIREIINYQSQEMSKNGKNIEESCENCKHLNSDVSNVDALEVSPCRECCHFANGDGTMFELMNGSEK